MGKNTFALGFNRYVGSTGLYSNDYEQNTVYANVTHKFSKNVRAYAEVAYADGENFDGKDLEFDTAYLAGLEVKF